MVRGAVIENASKECLDSQHPDLRRDEVKKSRNHYVEVGGTAGLENILPVFSKMTIHNIQAARDSMCSVIELEVKPLREMVMKDNRLLQKLWGFVQTRYIVAFPSLLPELSNYSYRHIKKFLNSNSAIFVVESGQTFKCPGGAILWSG